jgi:hypothetical protein
MRTNDLVALRMKHSAAEQCIIHTARFYSHLCNLAILAPT